jgi:sensor domain CHASE-containing protein
MVEWDVTRHYVPASLSGFQFDLEIPFQGLDGFEFDKCDLATSPGIFENVPVFLK